jgi:dihydrofolate reductase
MQKLRVESFSISIDGFGAGSNQNIDNPLGTGGHELHQWAFPTKTFQAMLYGGEGEEGTDNDFAARGFENIGAWILGRNMFGPVRGPWPDDSWKGWWGESPPYHCPVFVLTHHSRKPVTMKGGTTFYFVTDGIHSALKQAMDAANGLDVRIGGGVATIRQYLINSLIDELHIAISPILLGEGEHLLNNINLAKLGYQCAEHVPTKKATHIILKKSSRIIEPIA